MRKLLLKITAIATGCAMVCGTVLLVNAKSNKEVINTEVETLADLLEVSVQTGEAYWFPIVPTDETDEDLQELQGYTPIAPPAEDDPNECSQSENEGDYCAVALLFSITNPDLTGYTTVKDVIDNHPNCLGIASGDEDIDIDKDGYSRMPE